MINNLIVLLGPTGVGKTDIAVDLAQRFKCDIISADSRQFYRELEIGTAVPSAEQLSSVSHHFIRFLSVDSYYSSSLYERDVMNMLSGLFSKKNIVIMAGGSGMYIDAVCRGTDDIPDVEQEIRAKYNAMYLESGIEGLRRALRLLDPEHYNKVDLKNHKRIIRALEICESTGRPYSSFLLKKRRDRDFRIIKIGLKREREELYNRINNRVDKMISEGLENEARELYIYKNLNALNTVGYKEFFDFFEGLVSKDKAIDLIKRNSRRYAKRQMTWWAKDNEIHWFQADKKDDIQRFAEAAVSGQGL
ncbi:MAG TPA: tRNA (adenosine(37)-N6)-dimethylallyltransferase MiaA [Bacteroidales bacterium]|nr:tRNA (adenosine(37)-N6)-dimethylallyltransferase MiaA [Bacteroidales bacterium]